jgi:chromosome condensin MukBEF ATPase and DNA-binding subunit MukB
MKNQRMSIALSNADTRLLGLRAINPNLDFGNQRSVAQLSLRAEDLRTKLAQYNEAIAVLETHKNELRELEKQVNALSSQMLKGVGFEYGQDSHEYELAGGVRTRDRIRKGRLTRLKAASELSAEPRPAVA